MPSTYTGSGIELIGSGEQANTWDDTTNENLQIIDRLVSQSSTIALSGTTHTLTVADGALSPGQYAVLVFAGSPSGTNTVTISPNTAQRVYMVQNSSGQSVVLTQGSGGSVTVATGDSAIVYCDGAGASAAVNDLTANLAFPVSSLSDLGVTATAAELNILDGVTATTAELNILDGVTATAAELNILDGVTATAAELNILDGVTATASELNKLAGISDDVVSTTATQTLTNKTLTTPTISVGSDATGDLYYRTAGGAFARLPIGTEGQALRVVSGVPTWVSAQDGWVLLETIEPTTDVSTQAFATTDFSSYEKLKVVSVGQINPASDDLNLQIDLDSVGTWYTVCRHARVGTASDWYVAETVLYNVSNADGTGIVIGAGRYVADDANFDRSSANKNSTTGILTGGYTARGSVVTGVRLNGATVEGSDADKRAIFKLYAQ